MKKFITIALLPLFLITNAKDLFVSQTNGNANDGYSWAANSATTPWKTLLPLNYTEAKLVNGDTIHIKAGDYTNVLIDATHNITGVAIRNNNITIRAYSNHQVTVRGSSTNSTVKIKLLSGSYGANRAHELTIRGIDFRGFTQVSPTTREYAGELFQFSDSTGLYIYDCTFDGVIGSDDEPPQLEATAKNVVVRSSTNIHISNCSFSIYTSPDLCPGMTMNGDILDMSSCREVLVEHNRFGDAGHDQIKSGNMINTVIQYNQFSSTFHTCFEVTQGTNVIVRNNTFSNCNSDPIESGGKCIKLGGGRDNKVYNNLMFNAGSQYAGIIVTGSFVRAANGISRNNEIYNNTIYNMGATGIELWSWEAGAAMSNRIYNNIIHTVQNPYSTLGGGVLSIDIPGADANNGYGNMIYNNLITNALSPSQPVNWALIVFSWTRHTIAQLNAKSWAWGNIYADPQFEDAAAGDFRLKRTSRAIDMGASPTVPLTNDRAGNPRPHGLGIDIGAFEGTHTLVNLPGTIEAEDYSAYGAGISYYDTTPGNTCGFYKSDDVDITNQPPANFSITHIDDGEWLEYDVHLTNYGIYTITARVLSDEPGTNRLHIRTSGGGTNLSGTIEFTNTSGLWTNAVVTSITLDDGVRPLRISLDSSNFMLDNVDFSLTADLNYQPVGIINSPTNLQLVNATNILPISISANDRDGFITNVSLRTNGIIYGNNSIEPFSFILPGLATGTNILSVKLFDNEGATNNPPPVKVVSGYPPYFLAEPGISRGASYGILNVSLNGTADIDGDYPITTMIYRDAIKLTQYTFSSSFEASNIKVIPVTLTNGEYDIGVYLYDSIGFSTFHEFENYTVYPLAANTNRVYYLKDTGSVTNQGLFMALSNYGVNVQAIESITELPTNENMILFLNGSIYSNKLAGTNIKENPELLFSFVENGGILGVFSLDAGDSDPEAIWDKDWFPYRDFTVQRFDELQTKDVMLSAVGHPIMDIPFDIHSDNLQGIPMKASLEDVNPDAWNPIINDTLGNPAILESPYGDGFIFICQPQAAEIFNHAISHAAGAFFFPNIVEYLFHIQTNGAPLPESTRLVLLDDPVVNASQTNVWEFACQVKTESRVEIEIYDVTGKLIKSITNKLDQGSHIMKWDFTGDSGAPVPSGVKLVILKVGGRVVSIKKLALFR